MQKYFEMTTKLPPKLEQEKRQQFDFELLAFKDLFLGLIQATSRLQREQGQDCFSSLLTPPELHTSPRAQLIPTCCGSFSSSLYLCPVHEPRSPFPDVQACARVSQVRPARRAPRSNPAFALSSRFAGTSLASHSLQGHQQKMEAGDINPAQGNKRCRRWSHKHCQRSDSRFKG